MWHLKNQTFGGYFDSKLEVICSFKNGFTPIFSSTHHARGIDHYFADFYAGVYDQFQLFTKEYFQGKWLNPNLFGCAKKKHPLFSQKNHLLEL